MIKDSELSGKNNPYTLSFGKQPFQNIPRPVEINEVKEAFLNEPPTHQAFMITGVRGSGKTVLMTEIRNSLNELNDWEVIELSTSQDLLLTLSQNLYEDKHFANLLKQGGGLSVLGFGIQLNGAQDSVSPVILIREALEKFKKQGKKLLVCIDEIIANKYVKEFASIFQILIRDDLPIFLLMTGLFQNISNLMDEKNLTFLYRTPQLKLRPLNLKTIADNYSSMLGVSEDNALKMASLTKGYSFAFQVLGYYTYRHKGNYNDALPEYRQYLEDYVYEKIWSELSGNDRKLLYAVAASETGRAKEIKDILGIGNNKYTPYRDRLIKKMIIAGDEYGHLKITLPLMEDFITRSYLMDNGIC